MYIVRKEEEQPLKMFDLMRQFVPCEMYKLLINCISSPFIKYILMWCFGLCFMIGAIVSAFEYAFH